MITRRALIISAATFSLVPAAVDAAPRVRDPAAIVAEIYGPAGNGEETGAAFGLVRKQRRKYLTQSLDALWTKAEAKIPPGESGPIDWDVTTNSQGMEVGSFTQKVVKRDANHATIVVELTAKTPWLRKSPDENIISYHFAREHGRWMIEDIRSADDAFAGGLRDLLVKAAE